MAVQVIQATMQMTGGTAAAGAGRGGRLRVAAYCRVSTDSEEQESSYEAQCRHYTDYICANDEWELAGIYADEGITGTSTKKREQFNAMIRDCEEGRIDMILTKSISRWARNTIDSLKNIRRLRELGIPVQFEKENINTMDEKGEVLITIMSSLAQQESESISKNVRMGIQYLMQQGKGRLNTKQFLGLTKDAETGALVIVPEEADLVRRIYREYLEGFSPGRIASRLTEEGIPTPTGKSVWYQSTIVSILENEKYVGDLLLQKYFVTDVLTHKIIRNTGQLPQYFVADNHEPIVPRQVFAQVQGEMKRRASLKNEPSRFRAGSSQVLQGRLRCGLCGRTLKKCTGPGGEVDWRCRNRAYNRKTADKENETLCPCRKVPDAEAQTAVLEAFNRLPGQKEELMRRRQSIQDEELAALDRRVAALKEEILRLEAALQKPVSEEGFVYDETDCEPDWIPTPEAQNSTESSGERGKLNNLMATLRERNRQLEVLTLERAEAADRELRIRFLLELIDAMDEKGKKGSREITSAEKVPIHVVEREKDGACRDYEDFFERTKSGPDPSILDANGRLREVTGDLAIRFLDSVTVLETGYSVKFKAGIEIRA